MNCECLFPIYECCIWELRGVNHLKTLCIPELETHINLNEN